MANVNKTRRGRFLRDGPVNNRLLHKDTEHEESRVEEYLRTGPTTTTIVVKQSKT